jgi:cell division protease FtsH
MRLPERDQISLTRAKCKADLAVAMGGRVAEELIFGDEKVTSGASADIKMATKLSRAMATQFGMSDELGPLMYGENEEEVFLGHSVARSQNVSESTQEMVDREVKRFVHEGYETAQAILKTHLDDLHTIAKGLLEYETLSGDEIRDLLQGKAPVRESADDEPPPRASAVPTTGGTRRPPAGEGGLEPQPQG